MTKTHCLDRKKNDNASAQQMKHCVRCTNLHSPAQRQIREIITAGIIQPKLEIGAQDSECEREADRIAEEVVGNTTYGKMSAAIAGVTHNGGTVVSRESAPEIPNTPEAHPVKIKTDKELMEESLKIEGNLLKELDDFARKQNLGTVTQSYMDSALGSLIRQHAANILERALRADSPTVIKELVSKVQDLVTLGTQADEFVNSILMVLRLRARELGFFEIAQILPGGDAFSETEVPEYREWYSKMSDRFRSFIFLNKILIRHGEDRLSRATDPDQKCEVQKSLDSLLAEQEAYENSLKAVEENIVSIDSQYKSVGINNTIHPKLSQSAVPIVTENIAAEIGTLKGGGNPLPSSERAFFESRLNTNFGDVRIHTDTNAAGLAEAINAKAFTIGNDIAFSEGQYAPGSFEGKRLLAHELAHVVQKRIGSRIDRQVVPREIPASVPENGYNKPEEQRIKKTAVYWNESRNACLLQVIIENDRGEIASNRFIYIFGAPKAGISEKDQSIITEAISIAGTKAKDALKSAKLNILKGLHSEKYIYNEKDFDFIQKRIEECFILKSDDRFSGDDASLKERLEELRQFTKFSLIELMEDTVTIGAPDSVDAELPEKPKYRKFKDELIGFPFGGSALPVERIEHLELFRFPDAAKVSILEIEGYCDYIGSSEYNRDLGLERAAEMKKYLTKKGFDTSATITGSVGDRYAQKPGRRVKRLSDEQRKSDRKVVVSYSVF